MQSMSQMDSPKHDDVQEFTIDPAHLSDFTLHFRSASYHLHRVTLFAESKYFSVLLSPDAQVSCNKDCSLTSRCQQPDHHCVSLPDSQIGGTEVTANELMDFLEHVAYGVNRKDMHRWRRALKVDDYVDYEESKDQWCLAQVSEVSVGGLVTVRYTVNDQSAVESEKLNSEKLQQAFARTDPSKWRLSIQLDDDIACCDTHNKWLAARIIAKEDSRVRVHYIDWDPKWQEWIEIPSRRLAPLAYVYRDDIDICDEPVGLKLAHYFDTPMVLRYFYERAMLCIQRLPKKDSVKMWKLLLLSDQYRWQHLRSKAIERIVNCRPCLQWKTFHRLVSQETSAQLFEAALIKPR